MSKYAARKRMVAPLRAASKYLVADREADRTHAVVAAVAAALESEGHRYTPDRLMGSKGYRYTVDTLGILLGSVARRLARNGFTFQWDTAFEASALALTLHATVVEIDRRTT
jgi:hypothetical protein